MPSKIQDKVREVLKLFIIYPYNPILRRHNLSGNFKDFEIIDVTGNIRILIKTETQEIIDIIDIGNHNCFYSSDTIYYTVPKKYQK